jgi:hypothetical protein
VAVAAVNKDPELLAMAALAEVVVVAVIGAVQVPMVQAAALHLTQVPRAQATDPAHQQVAVAALILVVVEVAWLFLLTMADLAVRALLSLPMLVTH